MMTRLEISVYIYGYYSKLIVTFMTSDDIIWGEDNCFHFYKIPCLFGIEYAYKYHMV